jgi:hypothetical protein
MFFVQKYIPETKGLTLEQIEQQFREMRRVPVNRTVEREPLIFGSELRESLFRSEESIADIENEFDFRFPSESSAV